MEPEFAPQYSAKERWLRAVVIGPLMVASWLAWHWWLLPAWDDFAADSQCKTIFGISGEYIVFYGLFAGMPLFFAMVAGIVTFRSSLRSIASRQFPAPGVKVYSPTKIQRGNRATFSALIPVIFVILLLGIAYWGSKQANQIIEQSHLRHPHIYECKMANPSFQRTASGGR